MINVYPPEIITAAVRLAKARLQFDRKHGIVSFTSERWCLHSYDLDTMPRSAALRLLRRQCPRLMTEAAKSRPNAVSRFYLPPDVAQTVYEMAAKELK